MVSCYKSSGWFDAKERMRSLFLKHRRQKALDTLGVMESEQTSRNMAHIGVEGERA